MSKDSLNETFYELYVIVTKEISKWERVLCGESVTAREGYSKFTPEGAKQWVLRRALYDFSCFGDMQFRLLKQSLDENSGVWVTNREFNDLQDRYIELPNECSEYYTILRENARSIKDTLELLLSHIEPLRNMT